MTTRQFTSNERWTSSNGCTVMGFGIFLLMGLLFMSFFGWALYQDLDVYLNYVEGSCKITSKRLLESSGDDGPTYVPYFEFQVNAANGESYAASGYQRSVVYSSGRRGKEAILDRFSVEKSYPCWYNPQNPRQAVLARGLSWGWAYLFILLPLIFVVVGGVGVGTGVMNWGKSPEAVERPKQGRDQATRWLPKIQTSSGQMLNVRLGPQSSHLKTLLGAIFFALFWNGIVSIFIWVGLTQDDFSAFMWAFLSIFILAGLGVIYYAIRQLLIWITAGKTIVELSAEPLQFGQTAAVYVFQEGNKQVERVQLKLLCQEKVTYRQGTDTKTETRTFYEEVLYEELDFTIDRQGWQQTLPLKVPANMMHSFQAPNNEINWQIAFSLKVTNAPDFELAFPLRIVPPGIGG